MFNESVRNNMQHYEASYCVLQSDYNFRKYDHKIYLTLFNDVLQMYTISLVNLNTNLFKA